MRKPISDARLLELKQACADAHRAGKLIAPLLFGEALDEIDRMRAPAASNLGPKAAPLPWRQGRRVPEHVYDGGGRPLVTMPSATLARLVCDAVNGPTVTGAVPLYLPPKPLRRATKRAKRKT